MVALKGPHGGTSLAQGDVNPLLGKHGDEHFCRGNATIIHRGPRPVENDGLEFVSIASLRGGHGGLLLSVTGHARLADGATADG